MEVGRIRLESWVWWCNEKQLISVFGKKWKSRSIFSKLIRVCETWTLVTEVMQNAVIFGNNCRKGFLCKNNSWDDNLDLFCLLCIVHHALRIVQSCNHASCIVHCESIEEFLGKWNHGKPAKHGLISFGIKKGPTIIKTWERWHGLRKFTKKYAMNAKLSRFFIVKPYHC